LVFENFAENFFDLPICKVRGCLLKMV